ncbi:hypothetical protein FE236_00460 [Mariprofundus erugo]|uniref:hypothetical protein n=1 Tax=Mariprofundus erugo TaxID=2528639 RepID=UPI0010FF2847|nr:hypothetical protein [Mariprofundus erugo]TLS78266.1 hypothetical protein FE236_00460 [Mariprofundus erugo]
MKAMKGMKMALLVVPMLMAGVAMAADTESHRQDVSAAAIEQINLANKLAALGEARQDPLLLIAAAKLRKSISDEPVVSGEAANMSTQDMLKRAKALANGRKDLIGLAEDVEMMKSKGLPLGIDINLEPDGRYKY